MSQSNACPQCGKMNKWSYDENDNTVCIYCDYVKQEPSREVVTTTNGAEHWGACPECHDSDYFHNIGREHWLACHEHRTKWKAGENLFSNWREQGPEVWEKNKRILATFVEVEPWFPPVPVSPISDDTDYEQPF